MGIPFHSLSCRETCVVMPLTPGGRDAEGGRRRGVSLLLSPGAWRPCTAVVFPVFPQEDRLLFTYLISFKLCFPIERWTSSYPQMRLALRIFFWPFRIKWRCSFVCLSFSWALSNLWKMLTWPWGEAGSLGCTPFPGWSVAILKMQSSDTLVLSV